MNVEAGPKAQALREASLPGGVPLKVHNRSLPRKTHLRPAGECAASARIGPKGAILRQSPAGVSQRESSGVDAMSRGASYKQLPVTKKPSEIQSRLDSHCGTRMREE